MEEKRGRGRPRKETTEGGLVNTAVAETKTITESPIPELRTKRILTIGERESIERSLSVHKQAASATAAVAGDTGLSPVVPAGMRFNKQRLNLQAKDMARALEEGRPPEVNEKQKDALYARAKYLKEKLLSDQVLETRKELHVLKRDDPAWFSAMEKARMRPKYEADINEYRNIMRTLDPENPDADSLNILRRERD